MITNRCDECGTTKGKFIKIALNNITVWLCMVCCDSVKNRLYAIGNRDKVDTWAVNLTEHQAKLDESQTAKMPWDKEDNNAE